MVSSTDRPRTESDSQFDSIVGAVLTGGQSQRMGSDKATLLVDDRPLALRAIEVLQSVVTEVVIVSNGNPAHGEFGIPVIRDIFEGRGPLGGLHAVLSAAVAAKPSRDVFLLACDMPFVSADLVRLLINRHFESARNQSESARAVVPRMNEQVEPLCAVYSKGCLDPAQRAVEAGSLTMRDFLSAINTERIDITIDTPGFDRNLFSNINRPGDLLRHFEEKLPSPVAEDIPFREEQA